MATGLLAINHEMFSSKLFDEPVFRQCAQLTKCHFDEETFRRNGLLDEVSFDEVSHYITPGAIQPQFQRPKCPSRERTVSHLHKQVSEE